MTKKGSKNTMRTDLRAFFQCALALSFAVFMTACSDREGDPAELVVNNTPSPYHIVKKGETLSKIGSRYGVSKDTLIKLNGLKSPFKLFIGQKLIVRSEKMNAKGEKKNIAAKPNVADTGDVEVQELGNPQEQVDESGNPVVPTPTMGSGVPGSSTFTGVAAAGAGTAGEGAASIGSTTPGAAQEVITPGQGAAAAPASAGTMTWPVQGEILKSYGSTVNGQKNDGINIAAPAGTAVVAADNGVVLFSGNQAKGYGNLVILRHANNRVTVYGHLQDTAVKANQQIAAGQKIGSAGTSGGVSQSQVHFEVREGKSPKDPTKYLG